MVTYALNQHHAQFTTLQTPRLYKIMTLDGNMGTQGPFGALAAVNISANTAWFARDLPLYINPNDTRQTPNAINLYRQIAEC